MRSWKSLVGKCKAVLAIVQNTPERLDEIRFNQGLILSRLNAAIVSPRLQDREFRVFSQWGEDGILDYLVNTVPIENKTFIEFGVEDFFESNCRFLMAKNNWCGFVIDGSGANIERLKRSYFFWKHDLIAVEAFITRENINALLSRSGFHPDVGVLSIDLDGIDVYVLEAIEAFRPRILVCEYNAVFGPERKISVPYDAGFVRSRAHPSNLYAGASLAAIDHVATQKGYRLVGTNSAGNNAFFVRADLLGPGLEHLSVAQAFTPSRFREAKGSDGDLRFLRGDERLAEIRGLPVFNVETGSMEAL